MSPRPKAIKLAVGHVGDHSHRSPSSDHCVRKRPRDPLDIQASDHIGVLGHVIRVIIIDEPEPRRLPKNHPNNHRQKKCRTQSFPAITRLCSGSRPLSHRRILRLTPPRSACWKRGIRSRHPGKLAGSFLSGGFLGFPAHECGGATASNSRNSFRMASPASPIRPQESCGVDAQRL